MQLACHLIDRQLRLAAHDESWRQRLAVEAGLLGTVHLDEFLDLSKLVRVRRKPREAKHCAS